MKGGTNLSCQGHTARSVAEEGVEFGTFRLQIQGTISSLIQLPSPLNSKPADWRPWGLSPQASCSGRASTVQLEGPKAAFSTHPTPHRSLSDGRGRNSGTGGVSDEAGKRTKELRGGRRWRGVARRVAGVEGTLHHGI